MDASGLSGKDIYTFNGTVCENPSYQENILTEEEFEKDWKLKLSDLGPDGKDTAAVSVENRDFFANLFYIKMKIP